MWCRATGKRSIPQRTGTKAAAHYNLTVAAGETVVVRLRLADSDFKNNERVCQLR